MAVDLNGQPLKFDATTQGTTTPTFIRSIIMLTGSTSGTIEVTEGNGGRSLTGALPFSTNDRDILYVNQRVSAIYINALPTSAKVYIYTGEYPGV